MLGFIVKRLLQSILVMLAVAFITFGLFRFVGDPINNMVGQDTTVEERAQLRKDLGLDDPFVVQFARFTVNAMKGEFGQSYSLRVPVSELMRERLPATLELSIISAILALVLGLPMGIYAAIRRDSWVTKFFLTSSLVGVSLPTFLIGILLILIFGVMLRWLPTFGRGEVVYIGWWSTGLLTVSGLKAMILPAITLAIFQMTLIMRLVRAEMLEVLRTDFIKFGRARGLGNRSLHFRHALKNTLIPVITITGLQLGSIIAFSLITESVFQWPGMGLLFIQAIGNADIPIMAAYLVLIAFIFVAINLIVDILYVRVDPRLRVSGGKK
ncbi:ABC transporter permease [Cohaesibacter gelatinilyticus]|uniref:Peptide/nickel transport system permease protein n=1 Tax=Cohaesibacter gelatinilyticus TaxID=372072 RepID=A0A285NEK1_9HYPH|nr:ABC transporter permease [Cohaesibacter gelatinilyticus]SNZ07880.1 peptide/nickel transport system permease protein [Cohaesibacter gelatinilyticus]HAT85115.1 ABC transporter permease [Hyphomicrobiales bacterium]